MINYQSRIAPIQRRLIEPKPLVQIAIIKMLHLKKTRIGWTTFVNLKGLEDTESVAALYWSNEPLIVI